MNQKIISTLVIVLGALTLLIAAYIIGFPIVYSDTSTYIGSGFALDAPFDRPITYGLFLRLFSLNGVSLWLVIFSQALILSYIIFRLFNICFPKHLNINTLFLLSIIFISLFTSVSWTTSQLISDIFTPIMLLSLIILVIEKPQKKKSYFLYAIFLLATATHMSHITFNVILIISILIIRQLKFLGIKETINTKPLLICFSLSLLSILTMGSALSKSKHGFLMGAMVEHGITKKYLDEKCVDEDYEFCAYKDSLPDKAWQFLWNEDSPFYKMGSWKGTKEEFNEIIYNTFTTPKYIGLHIKESLKATADQLLKFDIGEGNGVFLEDTKVYKKIGLYFNHEISNYESSLQNKKNFTYLNWYNKLLLIIVLISLLTLFWIFLKMKKDEKVILSLILIVILAILINAWSCGTLANAIHRLGTKVIWLIPLISIIGVIKTSKQNTLN